MKLALGTVQFGLPYGIANQLGQVTRTEAKAMLHLASVKGIDMLDTAIGYGESETCLGEIGTEGFKLVTKLPSVPESCVDVSKWLREQVNESLTRLGVNEVYGLLLHRSEDLLEGNSKLICNALQNLKDSGKVKKIGISIYSPSNLALITKMLHLDLVQAPFNLVDRRLQTTGWLQRLKDDGVEIHTRSAFLQGLLLMPQKDIPQKFSPWEAMWSKWDRWLADNNVTAVQACLAFTTGFPEIDRVVVGADSVSQLHQIFDDLNKNRIDSFPDIESHAKDLINPSRWSRL